MEVSEESYCFSFQVTFAFEEMFQRAGFTSFMQVPEQSQRSARGGDIVEAFMEWGSHIGLFNTPLGVSSFYKSLLEVSSPAWGHPAWEVECGWNLEFLTRRLFGSRTHCHSLVSLHILPPRNFPHEQDQLHRLQVAITLKLKWKIIKTVYCT